MISQELRIKELQKTVQVFLEIFVYPKINLFVIQHLTDGKKKCERNRKREGKFLESVINSCKGNQTTLYFFRWLKALSTE